MSALRLCLIITLLGCGQLANDADASADGAASDAAGVCCNVKTGPCDAMVDSPYVGRCAPDETCHLGSTVAGYVCCFPNDANPNGYTCP